MTNTHEVDAEEANNKHRFQHHLPVVDITWVPMTQDELQQKDQIPKDSGFDYIDAAGFPMLELHVDGNNKFAMQMSKPIKFGG
eukprot:11314496-Ditylum_brightwellii.AAC.1